MVESDQWVEEGDARVASALCMAALVAVVLLATSAGGSNGGYTVRAIFDDAANIIPGENVKIGGVKVGVVGPVTADPAAEGCGRPEASKTPASRTSGRMQVARSNRRR